MRTTTFFSVGGTLLYWASTVQCFVAFVMYRVLQFLLLSLVCLFVCFVSFCFVLFLRIYCNSCILSTGSRGVQFEQVNKKTSYLLKCNHAFRFPLKSSSTMHLYKCVTVHCFKINTIVLYSVYSIVSLQAPLF